MSFAWRFDPLVHCPLDVIIIMTSSPKVFPILLTGRHTVSRLSSRLFTLSDIIIMGQLHENVRPDVQTPVCRDKTFVATKLILVAAPANDR